jgi:hypothetical protein
MRTQHFLRVQTGLQAASSTVAELAGPHCTNILVCAARGSSGSVMSTDVDGLAVEATLLVISLRDAASGVRFGPTVHKLVH